MSETVRCPACGASNQAPAGKAPFFCVGCKAIVDPAHRMHPEGGIPQSSQPLGPAAVLEPGPGYVSRYGSTAPRDAVGPGAGLNVGGSLFLGLMLAAIAGIGAALAFGWLGAHALRLPVVWALVTGWLIKRGLALGSGGGTPDRGLAVVLGLLAIVGATFVAIRFMEYSDAETRESARYREIFGPSLSAALADPNATIIDLKERDREHDGTVQLRVDDSTVKVEEESNRLRSAKATGKTPSDGYDIALLAATSQVGFRGHLLKEVSEGEEMRFVPRSKGIDVPGIGILFLWVVELGILLGLAFSRIE